MGYIEEQSEALYRYLPPQTKQADFDEFWADTLAQSKAQPLDAVVEEVRDYPLHDMKISHVTYKGFDGVPVTAWLITPAKAEGKVPCILHYHGFSDFKGKPYIYAHFLMLGYAVFAIDVREQGGDTGNGPYHGGMAGNVVSKGILDKNAYYFRAVYMDAVRAVDFVCTRPEIDSTRLYTNGASQGGALSLAVASLDERICAAFADIPSNCMMTDRIAGEHGSFGTIANYLRRYPERTDRVFTTLSYFDLINLTERITCPVYASVGLKDNVCPAKMFFAAYNRITAPKQINIQPFMGHEVRQNMVETKLEILEKLR